MINRRTLLGFILAAVPAAACSSPAKAATLNVYKTPTCGCCTAWVDHLRANGFSVTVTELDDVTPIARKLGVPDELRSCHTARVGGYFVEGHVPAADIRKLLKERPGARGIAVPGMPIGSPGMEQGDMKQPYETLIVGADGKARTFASHG